MQEILERYPRGGTSDSRILLLRTRGPRVPNGSGRAARATVVILLRISSNLSCHIDLGAAYCGAGNRLIAELALSRTR